MSCKHTQQPSDEQLDAAERHRWKTRVLLAANAERTKRRLENDAELMVEYCHVM